MGAGDIQGDRTQTVFTAIQGEGCASLFIISDKPGFCEIVFTACEAVSDCPRLNALGDLFRMVDLCIQDLETVSRQELCKPVKGGTDI